MLRRFGSIAIVGATLAAVVPVAAGMAAREWHERWVAELADSFGSAVELSVESYELGWLSSRAVLEVQVARTGTAVRIEETIAHGPLPWLDWAEGRFAPGLALLRAEWRPDLPPSAAQWLGGEAALKLTAHMAFDRSLSVELRSPSLSAPGLEWGGIRGRAQLQGGEGWGVVDAPRLRMTAEGKRVVMDGLHGQFRAYRALRGLPLGEWSVALERFELGEAGGAAPCRIADVELYEYVDERPEDLLDAWLRGSVEEAHCGGADYAPATFDLAVRNLDRVVLSVLQARLGESESDTERARHVMQQLPALLERGPQLELVGLHVPSPDGALDWSGRVWIDAEGPLPVRPVALIQAVRAEARLVTPSRWLHRWVDGHVTELIAPGGDDASRVRAAPRAVFARTQLFRDWIRRGWLLRQGERYVANLRLEGPELRIGGGRLDPVRLAREILAVTRRSALELERPDPLPASPAP